MSNHEETTPVPQSRLTDMLGEFFSLPSMREVQKGAGVLVGLLACVLGQCGNARRLHSATQ